MQENVSIFSWFNFEHFLNFKSCVESIKTGIELSCSFYTRPFNICLFKQGRKRSSLNVRKEILFRLEGMIFSVVPALTGVVSSSKLKWRICSARMRLTTTQSGAPGWTSCSASWRSGAPPSASAPPSARTPSTSTGSTSSPRIVAASLR